MLVLFLELVVLQNEIAVAVYDAFPQPVINAFGIHAIRGTGLADTHALITDLGYNLCSNIWVNWFAFGHIELHRFLSWVALTRYPFMLTDYSQTGLDGVLIILRA